MHYLLIIKMSKKFGNCCLVDHILVICDRFTSCPTIGEPVHFALHWRPVCNDGAFVGWAAQLFMWVGSQWNVPNFPASVKHCILLLVLSQVPISSRWTAARHLIGSAWSTLLHALESGLLVLFSQSGHYGVCFKHRHAMFKQSGKGPWHRAGWSWCFLEASCGIIWSGRPKKSGSSPSHHPGTFGCLPDICRQGSQDVTVNGSPSM